MSYSRPSPTHHTFHSRHHAYLKRQHLLSGGRVGQVLFLRVYAQGSPHMGLILSGVGAGVFTNRASGVLLRCSKYGQNAHAKPKRSWISTAKFETSPSESERLKFQLLLGAKLKLLSSGHQGRRAIVTPMGPSDLLAAEACIEAMYHLV